MSIHYTAHLTAIAVFKRKLLGQNLSPLLVELLDNEKKQNPGRCVGKEAKEREKGKEKGIKRRKAFQVGYCWKLKI